MDLTGKLSLLQETVRRLDGLTDVGPLQILCNEQHRFIVAEQMRTMGIEDAAVVLEPVGRNTAPAIAVAALLAMQTGADPVLLVMPADHVIQDIASFHNAIAKGRTLAELEELVVFGVPPTHPETGYGYIRTESSTEEESSDASRRVAEFVEKPDLERARSYVDEGNYVWNSGMFMFKASTYLKELDRHAPEIARWCSRAVDAVERTADFLRLDEEAFTRCPSDSIDYAVMENTVAASMVPLDVGWSDLGSWSAVLEQSERDGDGNASRGDVILEDCSGCYVHAQSRLVTAVGVEDHVIVETADAVLVVPTARDQQVKGLVDALRTSHAEAIHSHQEVARPWGSFTCIGGAQGFQVKRILVHPGASLSLQKHRHRAEHWVVVRGRGRITNGDQVSDHSQNEHVFIPQGAVHRLENRGLEPLELIEVQIGDYLGEDDIIRLEDRYGRG